MRKENGSASVYFMILFSALFLFNAVLVDFARYRVAELRAERAAGAAMRSLYSMFDPELQSYGLYGVDAASNLSFVTDMIERNLDYPGIALGGDGWVNVRAVPASIRLEQGGTLANADIFQNQVLEEMKYRAPIEYMLGIYDKLLKSSALEEVQEAEKQMEILKEAEELVKKRDQSLDGVWEEIELAAGRAGYIRVDHEHNDRAIRSIEELAEKLKEQSKAALETAKERLVSELEELLLKLDLPLLTDEERDQIRARQTEVQTLLDQVESLLETAGRYVEEVIAHDVEIELQKMRLSQSAGRIKTHLDDARRWNEELIRLRDTLEESLKESVPVLDPSELDRRESGFGEIISILNGYAIQWDPQHLLTGTDFITRKSNLQRMNDSYWAEARSLHAELLAEEQRRREAANQRQQQIDEETERGAAALKQALGSVFSCPMDINPATTVRLKELERKYAGIAASDEQDGDDLGKDLTGGGEKAFASAMTLVHRLQAALLSFRDKAYISEYALTKFNYRTLLEPNNELSKPHSHPLMVQEAEYILYGFGSCHLDQGAAYAEMFAFRFAVRTTEALLSPKKAVVAAASPWLTLLWAVAEGAIKAHDDMKRLVSGEDVELSGKFARHITLNYKDYLRVFMLVHGNAKRMTNRMQALIEFNTGIDLEKRDAVTALHFDGKVKLWFIPGKERIVRVHKSMSY